MTNLTIEYENQDLIIVNKPAGLPVYSTKKHEHEDPVVSWFLKNYPAAAGIGEADRPGVVHRIDKQTSGLLVLAKTAEAFAYLKKLFKSREIDKEYLALVYGELRKHGIIDQPLTKIGQEGRSRVRVDEKGKESVTEYWLIQHYQRPLSQPLSSPGERGLSFSAPPLERGGIKGEVDTYSLLRIKLHTGRTHQIRVHFSSMGHPVMGDNLYGKPKSQKLADILPRQFLHASRLEFKLMDGTWLGVESELPEDLKKVLETLSTKS